MLSTATSETKQADSRKSQVHSSEQEVAHVDRAFPRVPSSRPQHLASLQSSIGNQAVLRMMRAQLIQPKLSLTPPGSRLSGSIQAKLSIRAVNDPLEDEADRVADQVMSMPTLGISVASTPPQISRKDEQFDEEHGKAQRQPATPQISQLASSPLITGMEAPSIVHQVLSSPGQPLDAATRAFFEPRFGYNFSAVRVHADGKAIESARAVNATAYTLGRDIVLGASQYQTATSPGMSLLAHELTHTIQQGFHSLATVPRLGGQVQKAPLHAPASRKIRTSVEIDREAAPLAKDMGAKLDHWKNQADWGVQGFVNEELEKRIDALRSAGLTKEAFLQSLTGNLIWAAACFLGGAPALAFVVSLVGIGVAASAQPRSVSKPVDVGAVSGLAEEVERSLDQIENEIRGTDDINLLTQAKDLILFNPDLSETELLELFMTKNFSRSILRSEVGGKLTGFDDESVKKTQKQAIETRFQHFIDVVPLVGSKTEPETLLGKRVGGAYTLSLVHISGVGGEKPENEKWGIGYEIQPRQTDFQGKIVKPGKVAIAKWVEEDTVDATLNQEAKLKIFPAIINASAGEVTMGPEAFKADQEQLRKDARSGALRPG